MAPRKKKTESSKILRYPDSAMQSAIAAVREGRFKIREASRHFGVPHSTLINKLKGRVPEVKKMGRDTYLIKSEELLLKNYIIAKAKKGIHITRTTLLDTVQKILQDDKRFTTPFKNFRPGRKWVELFYKRYPELTEKKAEGISTARANVTAQDIKDWHDSLKKYLAAENFLDILEDPHRTFNADESGFQTCPESGKVLGPVGMKNFYDIKSGKEKEQLTVMVTINAAGQTVSPMIVYPLMRISKDISINIPEEWAIGKSKSGWMTGPLYFEYIANVLDPWIKENQIKKPVLLLIDGHRSHMTLQVSQYCEQNGIISYALFPNSTHICQPADVSVFKCLKSGWVKTVHEYKQNTGNRQISRAGFAPLLAKVFKEKVSTDVVKNGFMKCGIYPFDISAVDFTRCMDHETRKVAPVMQSTLETKVGVEIILLIESFMRSGRVEQFRRTIDEQWDGDESARELFYAWRKLRQRCMSNAALDEPPTKDHGASFTPRQAVISSTAISPSILEISPIVDTPQSKSFTDTHPLEPGTSFPRKNRGHQNIELQKTIKFQSSVIASLIPFSDHDNEIEAHALEPDTPPLEQDPDLANLESQTPTRFRSPILTPTILTPNRFQSPIPTPTMHLESLSASVSRLLEPPSTPSSSVSRLLEPASTPSASASRLLEPPSTKLVQLVAQKQKDISPAFGKHIIWPSDSPLKRKKTERLPYATTSKKWQSYWLVKEKEKEEKIKKAENRKRILEEKRLKKDIEAPNKITKRNTRDLDSAQEMRKRMKIQPERKRKVIVRNIFNSDTSDLDTLDDVSDSNDDRKTFKKNVSNRRIIRSDSSESDTAHNEKQDLCPNTYDKGDFVIFSYESSHYVGRIEDLSAEGALIKSMTKSLNNWKWPEKEDLNLYSTSDIIEKIEEPQIVNIKRGTFHVKEFKKYGDFV